MDDADVLAYVKAAARALAVPLDAEAANRVAVHLARTAQLAAALDDVPLEPHDEIAEIYRPAPFPSTAGDSPA